VNDGGDNIGFFLFNQLNQVTTGISLFGVHSATGEGFFKLKTSLLFLSLENRYNLKYYSLPG
jgi:hypothetical protein